MIRSKRFLGQGEGMNVYDFDKTIYDGDSTLDFYFYCLIKHPRIILCLPRQMLGAIRYMNKKIDKKKFKEEFYCFFAVLEDIDGDVICFWNQNQSKIKDWYREKQQENDVVISASPEFLLKEICIREGINNLIASRVSKYTGKYKGANCYGNEKVYRFKERYKGQKIDAFYSDSLSDKQMKELASKSYIVHGNRVAEWK